MEPGVPPPRRRTLSPARPIRRPHRPVRARTLVAPVEHEGAPEDFGCALSVYAGQRVAGSRRRAPKESRSCNVRYGDRDGTAEFGKGCRVRGVRHPWRGGYGFVLGSAVGVLVYGLIQVLIAREGLDSWWTKVFIGLVLLGFVVLQRVIAVKRE